MHSTSATQYLVFPTIKLADSLVVVGSFTSLGSNFAEPLLSTLSAYTISGTGDAAKLARRLAFNVRSWQVN